MVEFLRFTSCLKDLERPMKKKRAAASVRIRSPARDMPTMVPVEKGVEGSATFDVV